MRLMLHISQVEFDELHDGLADPAGAILRTFEDGWFDYFDGRKETISVLGTRDQYIVYDPAGNILVVELPNPDSMFFVFVKRYTRQQWYAEIQRFVRLRIFPADFFELHDAFNLYSAVLVVNGFGVAHRERVFHRLRRGS